MPAAKVTIEIRDSTNSIEGVLDVGSDLSFPLSITKTIASLNKMNKRGGAYTKTFKIPATKTNNKLLVNLYSANQRNVKAMKQKKDALILVDGVIIERGYIKILSSLVGKRPEKYTLKFFGDNLDWVTQLGELDLNNITFNNDTQTYSKSNIEASWTGTYDGGNDHVYPWINYGQYINGVVLPDPAGFSSAGLVVEDLRPALRWRAIIERTLNHVGYKLASDFMDTDNFKQLIYPHVGDEFKLTQSIRDAEAVRASSIDGGIINIIADTGTMLFQDDSTGDNFDTGGNYNAATGVYTIPIAGMYNFKFNFTINPVANSNDIPITIKRFVNGVEDTPLATITSCDPNSILDFSPFNIKICSQGFANGVVVTDIQRETGLQRYAVGDTVEFKYVKRWTGIPAKFRLHSDSWMKVEMGEQIIQDADFNISDVIKKKISVLDLFNDLTKCFNLYWRTDTKTKQVFVEPRDTFYKSISDALDWSDKLDVKKTPKLMFITDAYKRNLKFKYKQDPSDAFVKARNEEIGNELGSYIHIFPDRFIKGEQNFSTKLLSPSFWIRDTAVAGVSPTNQINVLHYKSAVTTRMWNEATTSPPPAFYDYNPRILNFKYATQKTEDGFTANITWHNVNRSVIPYAVMHPLFGSNVSAPYNLFFNGSDGLFATYYGRSIKLIEDGIRLEASFYLKGSDLRLDLRTPIYISKPDELYGYWIIDKINDWSPVKDRTTKVTLIKLINYDPVTIDSGQTPSDPEVLTVGKGAAIAGEGTTDTDTSSKEQRSSIVLANGTGNMAAKGSGSIAGGQGCVAPGKDQSMVGRYPAISKTDIYGIGVGEDENSRLTAFKIDKDGNPQTYGGEIQIVDSDGKIVPLYITGADNKIKKIYLKD